MKVVQNGLYHSVSRGLCPPDPLLFASTLLETSNKIFCLRPWTYHVLQEQEVMGN